jgi:hypothetical protein
MHSRSKIDQAFASLRGPARHRNTELTLAPEAEDQASVVEPPAPAGPAPTSVLQAWMCCAFCATRHSAKSAERSDARCAKCRSPLHAVLVMEPSGGVAPRRAVERLERRMPVQLEQSWPAHTTLAATSEDISIHGMRLVVPAELWIGALVRIACEFCDAVGEVTNVQRAPDVGPAAWRVGIRFLTICIRQSRGGLVSLKA